MNIGQVKTQVSKFFEVDLSKPESYHGNELVLEIFRGGQKTSISSLWILKQIY